MGRYWAVAALRLSECDYVPLDYAVYAKEVSTYLDEAERSARDRRLNVDFSSVREAAKSWESNARVALESARKGVDSGDAELVQRIHQALMKVERSLLDERGLTGRPWFKHLIYAPRPTYKAIVLPALTEAIEANDSQRLRMETDRLAEALKRAALVLQPNKTNSAR
jgi:N-acetylated-alpha-linked acidic dipeptidase